MGTMCASSAPCSCLQWRRGLYTRTLRHRMRHRRLLLSSHSALPCTTKSSRKARTAACCSRPVWAVWVGGWVGGWARSQEGRLAALQLGTPVRGGGALTVYGGVGKERQVLGGGGVDGVQLRGEGVGRRKWGAGSSVRPPKYGPTICMGVRARAHSTLWNRQ